MSQSKHTSRPVTPAVVAVACALLGTSELAAGDSRWYLETKLGQASLDAQFGSRWPKMFDGDHNTASVEVGYALNRYLGFQAGYHDLGDYQGFGSPCPEDADVCVAASDQTPLANTQALGLCVEGFVCGPTASLPLAAEVSGVSLSVVPRYPFTEKLSVYGKLGVVDWRSEVSGLLSARRTERFSDSDLLAGVGVQYVFPKGLGVLAEYQRLDLDVGSTSLGASWRF